MSIQFQASNDTFLRTIIPGFTSAKFPVSFGFWIKYDGVVNPDIIAGCGTSEISASHHIRRDWFDQQQYLATSGSGSIITETAEDILVLDTWYWCALTRSADANGTLYLGEQGQAPLIINNITDSMGPFIPSDWVVTVGSTDFQLLGGRSIAKECKLAEICLWDRVLSTTELTEIKEGASPGEYTTDLRGYWGVASTVEAVALEDQTTNGNDLVVHKVDGTTGVGSVPLLYIADHPNIISSKAIAATLVQDNIGTPYANKSNLHYALLSGDTVGELTVIKSGTDGTTNASGLLTTSVSGVILGDKLILNGFDPSGSDIHAADTVVLVGSVVVIPGEEGEPPLPDAPNLSGTFDLLDSIESTYYILNANTLNTGGVVASWGWVGTPPPWLDLDTSTGLITGTAIPGFWSGYQVRATNAGGVATSNSDSITITASPYLGDIVVIHESTGTTYYVDPTLGTNGDGSSGNPFNTLKNNITKYNYDGSVNIARAIVKGDILLCRTGLFSRTEFVAYWTPPTEPITIKAEAGQFPVVSGFQFYASSGFNIEDFDINAKGNITNADLVEINSDDGYSHKTNGISFKRCYARCFDTNRMGLSAAQWGAATSYGFHVTNSFNILFEDVYVDNVDFAFLGSTTTISVQEPIAITARGCVADSFVGDGFQVRNGWHMDRCVVKNPYNIDLNHDDGLQILEGFYLTMTNSIISVNDGDVDTPWIADSPNVFQGIVGFNNNFNVLIQNCAVDVDGYHAITFQGAEDVMVNDCAVSYNNEIVNLKSSINMWVAAGLPLEITCTISNCSCELFQDLVPAQNPAQLAMFNNTNITDNVLFDIKIQEVYDLILQAYPEVHALSGLPRLPSAFKAKHNIT